MKKKLLVLSSLAILLTLNISGCSFLTDIINEIDTSENNNSGNNSNNGNGGNNQKTQSNVVDYEPTKLVVNNKVTIFQLNDIFVIPEVSVQDDQGKEHKITTGFTISTKKLDNPEYDPNKVVDIDMSKTTDEDGITIYIAFQYTYNKPSGSVVKGSLTHSYSIRIVPRRDSHFDPEDDSVIKTLQISDVFTSFNQGDSFMKPKVWAIKYDNTKSEITDSCIFKGYDMDDYGYQNVTVSYNNHTISYEIVVHNKEEEQLYPFMNGFSQRLNIQKDTYVTAQKGNLFIVSYEKDGSIKNYGHAFSSFIEGVKYSSDNPDVVVIDKDGYFQAIAPGTAYLYVTINDVNGVNASTFRTKIIVEERILTELKVSSYKYNYYSGHNVNFAADVVAVYQNGYEEVITPEVDLSDVDTSTPGEYNVNLSYTVNGKTLTVSKPIAILDSALYVLSKTKLKHSIEDYDTNLGIGGTPTIGTIKSLVVPVKFTDSDKYISNYDNVREDIEKCFFGKNEDVGWRSVKTYYEEESAGLLTYTGMVSEIYDKEEHDSKYYYKDPNEGLEDKVVDWFFDNHPEENRLDYDANHDGYIDCLNLVYLVPDASTSGIGRDVAGNLWAMVKSCGRLPKYDKPVPARYFWSSYDFIYPTEDIALERTGKSKYSEPGFYNGNSNRGNEKLEARTYIHETAHMLGIDDYYSYSENVYFAGELNMQTLNYMGHDPYSLMLYNWADPYIPEITSSITIGDFQTTHDVILLTPSWNSIDSPFDEYFLLDLYVPTSGLNAFDATIKYPANKEFNTVGVRLWHVDSRLATASSDYDEFTFNPNDPGVDFITNNSYNREGENEKLKKYDRFMQLQLVRNVEGYDYATSGYVQAEHYFQAGDTFSMKDFSTQFVNGTKMDNGKELGWEFKIDGIYNSAEGYIADITVTRQ